MNQREIKSKLERNLEELYAAVREVRDEGVAIEMGKRIKYHQIAYKRLTGGYYLPKRWRPDDRQD